MDAKGKKIAAGAAVAAAAGLLIWAGAANRPADSETGMKKIRVDVVHQDGTTSTFEYASDEEYLGDLLSSKGLISGEEGDMRLFVTEVDGETADFNKDGAWWKLSVDGEDASVGVDSTPLQDGTVYTWTYTADQ